MLLGDCGDSSPDWTNRAAITFWTMDVKAVQTYRMNEADVVKRIRSVDQFHELADRNIFHPNKPDYPSEQPEMVSKLDEFVIGRADHAEIVDSNKSDDLVPDDSNNSVHSVSPELPPLRSRGSSLFQSIRRSLRSVGQKDRSQQSVQKCAPPSPNQVQIHETEKTLSEVTPSTNTTKSSASCHEPVGSLNELADGSVEALDQPACPRLPACSEQKKLVYLTLTKMVDDHVVLQPVSCVDTDTLAEITLSVNVEEIVNQVISRMESTGVHDKSPNVCSMAVGTEDYEEKSSVEKESQTSPMSVTPSSVYDTANESPPLATNNGTVEDTALSATQATPIKRTCVGKEGECAQEADTETGFKIPPPPPPPLVSKGVIPESPMPYNMKPKRTFTAPYRLKKAIVSPVSKSRLKEESVWVKVDESQLLNEAFLQRLYRRFRIKGSRAWVTDGSSSAVASQISSPGSTTQTRPVQNPASSYSRKTRGLGTCSKPFITPYRTLDLFSAKVSQSIAISMASAHLEPRDVALGVIELRRQVPVSTTHNRSPGNELTPIAEKDEGHEAEEPTLQELPNTLIDTLLANLPPPERILKLSDCPVEEKNLIEADQLLCLISPLRHRLPTHLNALRMLLHFDTTVEQTRQALQAACRCLVELRCSVCIPRILSCALALVNALNAAGYVQNSSADQQICRHPVGQPMSKPRPLVGFEMRNLVRLADTKDSTSQRNLVDYLAELMEINFGTSAHQWSAEIPSLDAAHALYCAKSVEETMRQLESDVTRLETDLRGVGTVTNQTDDFKVVDVCTQPLPDIMRANATFRGVMGPFLGHALHERCLLKQLHRSFSERFSEIAVYLTLDRSTYTADQLFADIKGFRDIYEETNVYKASLSKTVSAVLAD